MIILSKEEYKLEKDKKDEDLFHAQYTCAIKKLCPCCYGELVTVQVGLHTLLCRPYKGLKQERNWAIYMRSLPNSVTGQPLAELLRELKMRDTKGIDINRKNVIINLIRQIYIEINIRTINSYNLM